MNNFHQDWDPVIIRSKNFALAKNKEAHDANNKPMGNKEFQRLNNEENPVLKKITHTQAHAISNARNAIKLTQKELANKLRINEKIIKEYENCSVVNFSPNLFKRILKVLNIDPKLYI